MALLTNKKLAVSHESNTDCFNNRLKIADYMYIIVDYIELLMLKIAEYITI